ncbi:hypothetical protein KEM55_002805 [Ascosphaera atra]|nr:hypothetical protein KEM55_002805 [Ascosphaera atra]
MPPFLPRKRRAASPERRRSKRIAKRTPTPPPADSTETKPLDESSESSSLSSAPSTPAVSATDTVKAEAQNETGGFEDEDDSVNSEEKSEDEDDEEDEEDWEDAMTPQAPTSAQNSPSTEIKDLELTLDKTKPYIDTTSSKKGPSKIEREIRIITHCLHVQCLLYHNYIRNAWLNDKHLHNILREQVPERIKQEVDRWEIAAGLKAPPKPKTSKKKGTRRKSRRAAASPPAEPPAPDLSQGDPTIHILSVLAAYWKSKFKITAPGLRKKGYRPLAILEEEINAFHGEDSTRYDFGERIEDREAFLELARKCQGSRDVGAQLFTALLRSFGIESRMVTNLQPIGFGWTKAEEYEVPPAPSDGEKQLVTSEESSEDEDEMDAEESSSSPHAKKPSRKKQKKMFDSDLLFPVYWTEAISPVTHAVIPVETLVLKSLPNSVATTPELVSTFEPRGAKAEKAKQVIAYVVALSSDGTAKDVTTRYLKRRTWPGKTKGFRIPVEKVPINVPGGVTRYFSVDWFHIALRRYLRPVRNLTAADKKEDEEDLVPKQPERKAPKEGDTLQSLKASPDFVLERHLRREEALRANAKPVRTFTSGRGAKAKEEKVYRRSDVVRCLSAESWHKEGRQVKAGEVPLKRVPIRAVTLTRKREVEEAERQTGEKQLQGLYSKSQTEWIIPPPIRDGVIPKNAYGNIDCFVPSMVPKGATHVPYRGTVRVCKKLGVDYAEAVVGFEFGSKMAVPVIQGVVVASENADEVIELWQEEEEKRLERERLKHEKQILTTWRKLIMGVRIMERIQEEYGGDEHKEESNPFTRRRFGSSATGLTNEQSTGATDYEAREETGGGGFLQAGEEEELGSAEEDPHSKDVYIEESQGELDDDLVEGGGFC